MKDREQILSQGIRERNQGRFVFSLFLMLAVSSTSSAAASVPLIILDVLPQWAEIAMAGGGGLVTPGSFIHVKELRKWLKHADKTIADFKEQGKIEQRTFS